MQGGLRSLFLQVIAGLHSNFGRETTSLNAFPGQPIEGDSRDFGASVVVAHPLLLGHQIQVDPVIDHQFRFGGHRPCVVHGWIRRAHESAHTITAPPFNQCHDTESHDELDVTDFFGDQQDRSLLGFQLEDAVVRDVLISATFEREKWFHHLMNP